MNNNKNKQEQYYTIEEVAKMLKVAYLTIYRWIQDNKLPSVKAGKQYRIKKNDLDNFLNSYKGKNWHYGQKN